MRFCERNGQPALLQQYYGTEKFEFLFIASQPSISKKVEILRATATSLSQWATRRVEGHWLGGRSGAWWELSY